MIGQLIVQAVRAAGCGTLIAIDMDDSRLERARHFGADHVLNAKATQLDAAIKGLTGGICAGLAFEAVGAVSLSRRRLHRFAREARLLSLAICRRESRCLYRQL